MMAFTLDKTISSAEGARAVIGEKRILGVSTHNLEQVKEADGEPADYIAYGPIFATSSKKHADPVVGLEGIRAARAATHKPLVAIGGITRSNVRSVLEAGADSAAVISDLLSSPPKLQRNSCACWCKFFRAMGGSPLHACIVECSFWTCALAPEGKSV